ncbi:MAG: hypothetical protein E6J90_18135 [Deltaproteobacteria bacterium]|nr:MAG: hypothetical protein E6J91_37860 [Deltaproteobacteria bacterium]TMQ19395.1 MAG: hypothetical protein E6J90_18135 [Deltaproteobacteria bacterium]
MIRLLVAGLGAAWLACACRGGADEAAPPCSAVAASFLRLAQSDLDRARPDEATARAVADQLPAMRDALAQACSDGRWTAAVRICLTHATDHAGFVACEQQLTDEQRKGLDGAAGGGPGSSR